MRPNLYLHILDRELRSSVNWPGNQTALLKAVFSSLCLSQGQIYCAYSHLWESWQLIDKSLPLVRDLITEGLIVPASDHFDSEEFIHSRIIRYKHDRTRYPMYYQKRAVNKLITLQPAYYKKTSATDALVIGLRSWKDNGKSKTNDFVSHAQEIIAQGLDNRTDQAVTGALFTPLSKSDTNAVNIIRRQISMEYTRHYMKECEADIITGINELHFYDSLAISYPFHDLALFFSFVKGLGLSLNSDSELQNALSTAALSHGSLSHIYFCEIWRKLLLQIISDASVRLNSPNSLDLHRGLLISKLRILMSENLRSNIETFSFDGLLQVAEPLFNKIASKGTLLPVAPLHQKSAPRILLVVATNTEEKILLQIFKNKGLEVKPEASNNLSLWKVGEINSHQIFYVRTEMGTIGASASTLTVSDSVKQLNPLYVIMPGIAFGLKKGKQEIGDILVGRFVSDYETIKMDAGKIIHRGAKPECSSDLLSKARQVERDWGKSKVHIGELLSGCKLVNDEDFINQLKIRYPEAIGGEMEGAGCSAACHRNMISCIIIKSICDWGVEKDDKAQETAAQNSVLFCLEIINLLPIQDVSENLRLTHSL